MKNSHVPASKPVYMASKARLDELYGPGVAEKLDEVGTYGDEVKSMLNDYLGNESMASTWNPEMPPERIVEFRAVCELLRANTAERIFEALKGFEEMEEIGTNENREFLLKRFGLWEGV
jgi:hypothetical protein